ncbi:MAG: ISNCY family transposase [Acidobacteriaceae bacterium]
MRKAICTQQRLDCTPVERVKLNLECRDEIIPVLRGLQHIYSQPALRDEILQLVGQDVNRETRDDCGRAGLDLWQILVLAAVRLGCNLNYDKLQDLAEQHRALRHIMAVGDWDGDTNFNWRRIRDNVCLLQPVTIERISHLVVAAGHRLEPKAIHKVRADSFVVETNIHHPTESTLILDGTRKVLELCTELATAFDVPGWRQQAHLLKKIKQQVRLIGRYARSKSEKRKQQVKRSYQKLLGRAAIILNRAGELVQALETGPELDVEALAQVAELQVYISRTQHVCGTAHRRVDLGEQVPNSEKLFSIFEPHTQLYKRGKAGTPVQFGRLVLIYEDQAGFVVHHHLLPRDAQDRDVAVEQTRLLQERVNGKIRELSFDSGFHSPENQEQLLALIKHPCLPTLGSQQAAEQWETASVRFRQARQRHAGVESAIGALQSGNGLKRTRDRSLLGFERYVILGILGRNIHTLGKLLIRRENASCEAACTYRAAG